ncbi:MAG: YegP family protein [Actinomycetes bacterium]
MAASADLSDRHHGLFFHLYSSPSSGGVRWRLLGANNRELGRSCLAYPDVDLCRAGLARTLLELPTLVPAVMRVDHSHWGWRLRADTRDVVGSGHAFDRRPRCEEACVRFVEQAPHASVRDSLTVMPWGSRNMRPSVLRNGAAGLVGGPDDHRWSDVHADSAALPPGLDVLPAPRRGGVSLQGLQDGWREQSR